MSETSTIPAAMKALRDLADAATGATVSVVLGPPLDWAHVEAPTGAVSESKYLFIGAAPDTDTSATGEQDFNAAGAVSRDEVASIVCTAWTSTGDPSAADDVLDGAFAIVATVEQAIRSDPSLTGSVLYARVGSISRVALRQTQTGPDCTVQFDVMVRSYLS